MNATLSLGLRDPVHDAQHSFRAALQALSRPGQVQTLGQPIAGLALGPALSNLLLALTDEATAVWWQQPDAALAQWLRFHTGAGPAVEPSQAAFGVVTRPGRLPPLADFAGGTPEAPEQSATLLIEVPTLRDGPAMQAHGPGIRERAILRIGGLSGDFWAGWQGNHARFPQGVDLFFACGNQAIGLPRTTRVDPLDGRT